MLIRPVAPGDRESWLRMRADLWPEEADANLNGQMDAFLRGDGAEATFLSAVFVSEVETGGISGFLELFIRNYAEDCDGPTPYIEGWYVVPDLRGKRIGRALVSAAEEWAREHGFHELASDTPLENEASQLAHEALGFEEVERIVHFRKAIWPRA